MTRSSFRDLRVWKDAIALTTSVYKFTANFPRHELYGLSQQIRRAAVSVPSNIAEGKGRYSDRDFVRFLLVARGSLLELETQLIIAQELGYLSHTDAGCLLGMAENVGRALSGLINSLSQQAA
jgi:four helix bundle protein